VSVLTDPPHPSTPQPRLYRFGSFTLDARERRLLREGVAIPLKPRAFDTLLYLVERAGHLVTKEELIASLWPDAVVEESNLAKNVWLIRRALGGADGETAAGSAASSDGETRFIETVPRTGYRFVAPVARLDPAASGVPPTRSPPAASRSALALGGAAVVLALLALWAFTAGVRSRLGGDGTAPAVSPPPRLAAVASSRAAAVAPPRAAAVAPSRPAVAVLGFENLARRGDAAWIATALAEMMSADLAAGERLRLVPGVDAMRLASTLPTAPGALGRDALAAARWQLAADYVVKGSYLTLASPDGEVLRLDVVLQSTTTGETVATVSGTGATRRMVSLIDDAVARLRAKLGLEPPATAASTAAAAAALPAQPAATRLYAEGLAKLRQYDALGARPLLERAIAIEAGYPLAHVALSQALSALGYDQGAVDEAKRAVALAGRLTRAQQLEIAAGLAEAQKDWTAAANTERALFAFFPDDLEYGLNLARTQIAGGKAAEALTVIAALRRRPAPASQDPRLDLAEAAASGALSDWPRQLASAERAAAAARTRGLRLLLGEALAAAATAEGSLGQRQAADAARREAADIFRQLGNTNAEASALLGIANGLGDRGDYDGAIALYRQALASFERTGNRKGAAHAWSDIANMSWMAGDVEASLSGAEKELALSREIDDRRGIVWGLGAIGNALADQGEIARALRMQGEALAISREIGDREYAAFSLGSIADTQLTAGELEQAYRGYGEALALCRELHDASGIARHEDDLATVLLAEGRLAAAERLYGAALDDRRRLDEQDAAAQTRMNLAQLRNEQQRPAEGLALSRQSAQAFTAMHQSGNVALALATGALAEIQLRQGAAAAADCERARAALAGNRQNQANLFVLLTKARVEAANGRPAPARALAAAARARAEGTHALGSVLEARLILGEIELREDPEAGARQLQTLAREARAKSFLLIAGKAAGLVAERSGRGGWQ